MNWCGRLACKVPIRIYGSAVPNSTGIENPDDLIADLEQGLGAVHRLPQ
jgi:O-acetylhomoserine/O-acetylserine sulfhydrylase-like pyridoxal-dependent enzyme